MGPEQDSDTVANTSFVHSAIHRGVAQVCSSKTHRVNFLPLLLLYSIESEIYCLSINNEWMNELHCSQYTFKYQEFINLSFFQQMLILKSLLSSRSCPAHPEGGTWAFQGQHNYAWATFGETEKSGHTLNRSIRRANTYWPPTTCQWVLATLWRVRGHM